MGRARGLHHQAANANRRFGKVVSGPRGLSPEQTRARDRAQLEAEVAKLRDELDEHAAEAQAARGQHEVAKARAQETGAEVRSRLAFPEPDPTGRDPVAAQRHRDALAAAERAYEDAIEDEQHSQDVLDVLEMEQEAARSRLHRLLRARCPSCEAWSERSGWEWGWSLDADGEATIQCPRCSKEHSQAAVPTEPNPAAAPLLHAGDPTLLPPL